VALVDVVPRTVCVCVGVCPAGVCVMEREAAE
jgi:hypothetical protein